MNIQEDETRTSVLVVGYKTHLTSPKETTWT